MDLRAATQAFLAHRQDKHLSDGSLAHYGYWLDLWQDWRHKQAHPNELFAITADELRAFFRYLEHEHVPHAKNPRRPAVGRVGMKAHSRASGWRILRAFWTWCADEGALTGEQMGFFRKDRVPRPRIETADEQDADDSETAPGSGRAIDVATVRQLIKAAGIPFEETAARNRAIILLLHESGMRVSELCSINDRTLDLELRTAKARAKGNRWRFVFWGPEADAAIHRYLKLRRGETGGKRPLFRGVGSTNSGLRLTGNAVRGMLKRLAEKAGVQLPFGAPAHGFRSAFAQRCLDEGIADLDLQQLLGHNDIRSTAIYARRHPKRLRAVHRRIFDRPLISQHMQKRRTRDAD
jgi:site-specific recombinase XerD